MAEANTDTLYAERAALSLGALNADGLEQHARATPLLHERRSPWFPVRDFTTGRIPYLRDYDFFARKPNANLIPGQKGYKSPYVSTPKPYPVAPDSAAWDNARRGARPVSRFVFQATHGLPLRGRDAKRIVAERLNAARMAANAAHAATANAAPAAATVSFIPGEPARGFKWFPRFDGVSSFKTLGSWPKAVWDKTGNAIARQFSFFHPAEREAAEAAGSIAEAHKLKRWADKYEARLKSDPALLESVNKAAARHPHRPYAAESAAYGEYIKRHTGAVADKMAKAAADLEGKATKAAAKAAATKNARTAAAAAKSARAAAVATKNARAAADAAARKGASVLTRALKNAQGLSRSVSSVAASKYSKLGMAFTFAAGRTLDAAINASEFVDDWGAVYSGGNLDALDVYNKGGARVRVSINGPIWTNPVTWQTYGKKIGRGVANVLGDFMPLGAASYDDSLIFNIKDAVDNLDSTAREDYVEYVREQGQLALRLMQGDNPVTGEPLRGRVVDENGDTTGAEKDVSLDLRTRDQRLSDALQQRYLESAFFKSFDPKWADDHKDQVQEVYRQIAGRGRSPVTAGYLTPNLMASAGGLDVGYANAAGLKDMTGSDGSLTLFMPGATEADPPRPFDPAEIDAARFHSLVMYEQKRYDDEMAKVAANVADWDNFIKNAPDSIRKSYAYVDDINEHGGVVRRVANRSQAYRDDAEDNLRREHEIRMSALAASPAAQRLATANALRLYKLATGNDLAHDYVETGPDDMYDKDLYPGLSESNFYGAPNFAKEYLDKTPGGRGWVAKPGSDLWTLSDDELRKKAEEVFDYYTLSRDGATLE